MRWEPTACQAGDIVRVRLGSVYHYGIFVSEDEVIQFGLPPTAGNRAKEDEVKVLATDIDVFACGCIVERACLDRSEQRRRIPPSETVARARARLGESGYNLIHNNCEHFVNECVFGESRCTQEEDVRSRWLNRPICDVYVARISEAVSAEGIYPEKRRAEIESIVSEDLRRNARFLWQLLGVAAQHSFHVSLQEAGLKRRLGGKWVSDKFFFALRAQNGLAVAVVSNAAVSLRLNEAPQNGSRRILREPRMPVEVKGKNSAAVKYFWVENGALALMGNKFFE
ncbi:MAG: lecithin retinol acyltransferase family protein [Ruminococcus sp.]